MYQRTTRAIEVGRRKKGKRISRKIIKVNNTLNIINVLLHREQREQELLEEERKKREAKEKEIR